MEIVTYSCLENILSCPSRQQNPSLLNSNMTDKFASYANTEKSAQCFSKYLLWIVLHIGYLNKDVGQHKIFDSIIEINMQPLRPAKAPSKVFFGLILVSGVRPNACKKKDNIIAKVSNKLNAIVKNLSSIPYKRYILQLQVF